MIPNEKYPNNHIFWSNEEENTLITLAKVNDDIKVKSEAD